MLDARLTSAAKFVRQGATFADVGTDHAHLPIFLLKEGRITRAVCSDINEGPLRCAVLNAEESGVSHLIDFRLCDGAGELSSLGITDLAVCGMGGELIRDIIDGAPWLFDGAIRLILQPMTRQDKLRAYLAERGFSVLCEEYSFAEGKYYVTLVAEYCALPREISAVEAELGSEAAVVNKSDAYYGYLTTKLSVLRRRIEGRRIGGASTDYEQLLCSEIENRLEKRVQ